MYLMTNGHPNDNHYIFMLSEANGFFTSVSTEVKISKNNEVFIIEF